MKEAVKTALIRVREIEQTTKKVLSFVEAKLAHDNNIQQNFFLKAEDLMEDYIKRQDRFEESLKDIAQISMEELPRFNIDFSEDESMCRLDKIAESSGIGGN